MTLRGHARSASAALVACFVAVGITSCGTSDAVSSVTVPSPSVATTAATAPTSDNVLIVTDAEVADLEKQLDEIDQLLTGVDSDLSQD